MKKQVDYHLSGVCGAAMATLAVMLKQKGYGISGSDVSFYPPMDVFLKDSGIEILSGYDGRHLQRIKPHKVIIGNVLSRGNPEVEYCLENHIPYCSSAEILKEEFIRGNRSVVVVGTHGKTTAASMAVQVFDFCGKKPGYFIGGIPGNFSVSGRACKSGRHFISEGDEYDTAFFDKRSKFFHYLPDCLLLNNLEFDHRDIFENLEQLLHSFRLMLRQIPQTGKIFVNGDDQNAMSVIQSALTPVFTVGENPENNYRLFEIEPVTGGGMKFKLAFKQEVSSWEIEIPGKHNAKNAAGVIALALSEGLQTESIFQAMKAFRLPKRRLEKLTENQSVVVYDDFAHHPTAIFETINAVRTMYQKSRLIVAYEPRSNTSVRNDHQKIMVPAFKDADLVFFTELHCGKSIIPEERLDLGEIIDELNRNQPAQKAFQILEISQFSETLKNLTQPGDVFLLMSQGSFFGIPKLLANYCDEKF